MPTDIVTNTRPYDSSKPPFLAAAFDGGGARGLYSCSVLATVAQRFAGPGSTGIEYDVGARFNLIAGVSTGAILAAALAMGFSPDHLVRLYRERGQRIFPSPVPRGQIAMMAFAARHFSRAFNPIAPLREALVELFGSETFDSMHQARKIALCIPTVDVSTHRAWVYKTGHLPLKTRDNGTTLVDACLASSAAPLFFPLAYNGSGTAGRGFCDGGLFANNPVMIALIEALAITQDEPDRQIQIVSIGTCPPPAGDHATEHDRNWGLSRWLLGKRIVEMALDVQVSAHENMAHMLVPHLDRKITIIRLPQSVPGADEGKLLGMDRADKTALDILERRAQTDASTAHSEAMRPENAAALLVPIFSNLQPAKTKV